RLPGGLGSFVLAAGALQQVPPGRDIGAAAQQRPPLPFGHAAPDAVFDPVVQRLGQAFGAHRAAAADELRAVLRGPLHEQRVGIGLAAVGLETQFSGPHVAPLPRSACAYSYGGRAPSGRAGRADSGPVRTPAPPGVRSNRSFRRAAPLRTAGVETTDLGTCSTVPSG